MDVPKVAPRSAAFELAGLLDSPEIAGLVRELEATRWTGRPGYPIRCMIGMALAKSMYAIPTWTRTVRLVAEHDALQAALGCADGCPSEWACYRFTAKLRKPGSTDRTGRLAEFGGGPSERRVGGARVLRVAVAGARGGVFGCSLRRLGVFEGSGSRAGWAGSVASWSVSVSGAQASVGSARMCLSARV